MIYIKNTFLLKILIFQPFVFVVYIQLITLYGLVQITPYTFVYGILEFYQHFYIVVFMFAESNFKVTSYF